MTRTCRPPLTLTFAAFVAAGSFSTNLFAQAADSVATQPPATAPGTAPATAPATEPAVKKDLPNAIDVINAGIEAMGGKKAWDKIDSTRIKATLTSPMGDLSMDMYSMKPDMFLIKQSIPNMGEAETASDGVIGWNKNPMTGAYQLLDKSQTEQTQRQSSMYRMSVSMLEDFTDHKTIDTTTFNDVECHKISMKDQQGAEQVAYFSVPDKLIQGFEITQETPMGALKSTIKLSDWKEKGDVKYFTKMTVSSMGQTMPLVFEEVEFNTVEKSIFERPAEVKALLEKQASPSTQPGTAPTTRPGSR